MRYANVKTDADLAYEAAVSGGVGRRSLLCHARSFFSRSFRRRLPTIPTSSGGEHGETQRTLSLVDLILLGVGGTLGSGLFLLAGRAARDVAGPAITLSFLLAAITCVFSGLSYAEMASRLPACGGAYAFAYAAIGELPAFLVGMCVTLEYGVSSAAVARAWAAYVAEALRGTGVYVPDWISGANGNMICVFGFVLVAALSALLAVGMREAKCVINCATGVYALVVAVVVGAGSTKVELSNWKPFFPFGMSGVLTGASAVFFSYIGFDEVATVAEEAVEASKTVPFAILSSLAIVTLAYVAATLVLTGMINYTKIDVSAPFAVAFRVSNMPVIAVLVSIGTAAGMLNTALVGMAAQSRIFIAMGRDALIPRTLGNHARLTTIICGTAVAFLALAIPTQALADIVSGGTLLAFLATNVSLLLTRARLHSSTTRVDASALVTFLVTSTFLSGVLFRAASQNSIPAVPAAAVSVAALAAPVILLCAKPLKAGVAVERVCPAFLCPLVPIVPALGVISTGFLACQLETKALLALFAWLLVSVAVYVLYGARSARDYEGIWDSASVGSNASYNSFDDLVLDSDNMDRESGFAQRDMFYYDVEDKDEDQSLQEREESHRPNERAASPSSSPSPSQTPVQSHRQEENEYATEAEQEQQRIFAFLFEVTWTSLSFSLRKRLRCNDITVLSDMLSTCASTKPLKCAHVHAAGRLFNPRYLSSTPFTFEPLHAPLQFSSRVPQQRLPSPAIFSQIAHAMQHVHHLVSSNLPRLFQTLLSKPPL